MNFAAREPIVGSRRVKFIEAKQPDMDLVDALLDECRAVNHWANFGPLHDRLAAEYAEHMNLPAGVALTPCANGGIALELLARALAAEAGKPALRWVGSAFSFKNLGRGYFADMTFLDCDRRGVLDLAALEKLPPDSYDGIVVTNPFGMHSGFEDFIRFARATGKKLLIDNAAGIDRHVPDWPWQAFSLHHTKPYGMGEGGLALAPAESREFLRLLINYDKAPSDPSHWLNNGKISDISCAFLIARLRRAGQWEPAYMEQRQRVLDISAGFGLSSLLPVDGAPPTTSLPILFGAPVEATATAPTNHVDIARQYEPLAPLARVRELHAQMVNFPTHPDMCALTDTRIAEDIERLLEHRAT